MSEPVIVHIAYARIFEYEGWVFEYHRNKPFPPWPLKVDGEPRKRAGRKFWAMFDRFNALPIDEQEKLRMI